MITPMLALLGMGFATAAAADDMTISASKLSKDASQFYGKTVMVKAEVEDVLGAHSFTLDEDAVLAGADVLVLVPSGMDTAGLKKDDKVIVTGRVRQYVARELETDYDWFKNGEVVNKGVKVEFEKRPVLIATSVRSADGRDLMTGARMDHSKMDHAKVDHSKMDHSKKDAGTHAEHAVAGTTISAGKLAKDPKQFYGQMVTVKAEVEDVIDSRSFTLDEDALLAGADVLVLVPAGITSGLAHDQVVVVSGKVRPYAATELKRDYDWFDDGKIVTRDHKLEIKTRPVLVATSVRTSAGVELLTH